MAAEVVSSGDDDRLERVFLRPDSAVGTGKWLIVAGIGGMCFALVGFAVAAVGRTGVVGLHTMSTLPALLSVGALTAGWTLLCTPRRVDVGPEGFTFETGRGARLVRWSDVGYATVDQGGLSHRRRLVVTDLRGKRIVTLDESFDDFAEMVATIASHIEAKGDNTAERLLRKKAIRQGALTIVFGLLMTAACIFVARMTYEEQRAKRLLAEKGQPGRAEILRRFTAPNGVTRRLEYRVVGNGGRTGTRNAQVEPWYWLRLAAAKTVPVIYVPEEPAISRLAHAEVKENDLARTPLGGYGLAAGGGLLGLFLVGAGLFAWNGWDLGTDAQTQKLALKRYGKVVWRAGAPRAAPASDELRRGSSSSGTRAP
jgi:hypothetical protein